MCGESVGGIVEVLVVLSDPSGWEEPMGMGDMLTEGVVEVSGGVRGDSFVEMVEGILKVEDRWMQDM